MVKYLVKGKLTDIIGSILEAHIELEVEEEGSAAIEALLQNDSFPFHLFTEGHIVIDNYRINECGAFESIEYEEIVE